jgi:hypothetical protein
MSKGLIINEDVWVLIDILLPEEQSEPLKCLAAYHRGQEVPKMSRMVTLVFQRIALDNGRFDPEKRAELSAKRSEAGKIGGSKPKQIKQTEANEANESKISKTAQEKKRIEEKRIEEIRAEEKRKAICPLFEHEEVVTAWREWVDMRKQIKKPMVGQAESRAISNLMNLSGGDPSEAVKILNQSTDKCWIGLFALRHDWKDKGKDVFDEWAKA